MVSATHVDFSRHTFPMLKTGCFTATKLRPTPTQEATQTTHDVPHSSKAHCVV